MIKKITCNEKVVFTHGDFHPRNIIIKNKHVEGIIDWEFAGNRQKSSEGSTERFHITPGLELFNNYGVENLYGIFLLHKHYDILKNEIVIQKGLITSPTTENIVNKIPNMIKIYENGKYEILEYTESNDKFICNEDFFKKFYDLIKEKKLINVLGITTINNKDGYYLEHTEERNNILTPISEDEINKNSTNIPTNWFFNSPVYDACISSYQCRRTTVCNVFCRSTPRRGHTRSRHDQTTGSHNTSRTGHQRA